MRNASHCSRVSLKIKEFHVGMTCVGGAEDGQQQELGGGEGRGCTRIGVLTAKSRHFYRPYLHLNLAGIQIF